MLRVGAGRYPGLFFRGARWQTVRRESVAAMGKLKLSLYYGTVKSATGGRHFMAWANSREHALNLIEAALTATEPVQGSVVGPLMSLRAGVVNPGVYVETKPAPKRA